MLKTLRLVSISSTQKGKIINILNSFRKEENEKSSTHWKKKNNLCTTFYSELFCYSKKMYYFSIATALGPIKIRYRKMLVVRCLVGTISISSSWFILQRDMRHITCVTFKGEINEFKLFHLCFLYNLALLILLS